MALFGGAGERLDAGERLRIARHILVIVQEA
jgi:hypothetical protein